MDGGVEGWGQIREGGQGEANHLPFSWQCPRLERGGRRTPLHCSPACGARAALHEQGAPFPGQKVSCLWVMLTSDKLP